MRSCVSWLSSDGSCNGEMILIDLHVRFVRGTAGSTSILSSAVWLVQYEQNPQLAVTSAVCPILFLRGGRTAASLSHSLVNKNVI